MRNSLIAAVLFAAVGAASLATSASAAPVGPSAAVAAPADIITDVRMHRMNHGMQRSRMMRHHGMRHRMHRRMMRRM